eukprot:CAMPEP_0194392074 /NCGR_PEP_ID=MMETSP0174-20130528/119566_1 /TAXON_ID=216777 /ORGANISM="Proboscia alata, Strain PI-D3" /LENGTH=60 /DNA_ID=CAMNT_0039187059 /DNA_START=29 /DNA_END=207 /DNA_ORIENTATION=-
MSSETGGAAAAKPPPKPPTASFKQKTILSKTPQSKVLNINVGVLGHVDSGKTSLVKTLST